VNDDSLQDSDEIEAEGRPSKSARKRELLALQRTVEDLGRLSRSELQRLGISGPVIDELLLIAGMRSSGARNRQIRHCAASLEREPLQAIGELLAGREAARQAANQEFHRIERWRDRLLAGGDAVLGELLDTHPDLDRQHLRRLIRAAQQYGDGARGTRARRELFQYLRDCLIAS